MAALIPHLHAAIPYGSAIVQAVAAVFLLIAAGFALAPVFDRTIGGR